MTKLPPIMKKGSWERDLSFSSFEFKGETITIDTEEKYIYWNNLYNIMYFEEFHIKENFMKLGMALENFLYVTHRADDKMFDK